MRSQATGIIGAPTSAGAHYGGQELAPAALRQHGFSRSLRDAGLQVQERTEIGAELFATDAEHPTSRNLIATVRAARAVADAVDQAVADGLLPIVLGGDCTITLGVVAGLQRHDSTAGLLYFDGDADLATPATTRSGILDSMGIAHFLGLADTELGRLERAAPMLTDDRVVVLGYDATDPDPSHDSQVFRSHPGLVHFPSQDIAIDPSGVAARAVESISRASESAVLHFDVDAVDSADLPLADYPHYGVGVTLEVAREVLSVLSSAPNICAVVLTEVNPTHDPTGELLRRYVSAVGGALANGLRTHNHAGRPSID